MHGSRRRPGHSVSVCGVGLSGGYKVGADLRSLEGSEMVVVCGEDVAGDAVCGYRRSKFGIDVLALG